MPISFGGTPPTHPYSQQAIDFFPDSPGGTVVATLADTALNYGDLVFKNFGGYVSKNLDGSIYMARFMGVVVGGDVTNGQAIADPALVGQTIVSAAGKTAIVQIEGVAWVATDINKGATYYGQQVIAGQTTAGRALSFDGNHCSFITQDPGLVISAGGSAVGKVSRAAAIVISGVSGTSLTAATNTAALTGTVTNGNFQVYMLRSTGAANQTLAAGTQAATLQSVVLPAAPAVSVATYGAIIVHPTGTGNFVGGTTALDDATVVPNAAFVSLAQRFPVMGFFIDTTTANAGAAVRMRIQRE